MGSATAIPGSAIGALPAVPHFISNVFVPPQPCATSDAAQGPTAVVNPATGVALAVVPREAAEIDVSAAVDAAQRAFPAWRDTPLARRIDAVNRWRTLVHKNVDRIAENIMEQLGKVPADARGDVVRGLEVMDYACALAAEHAMAGRAVPQLATGLDALQYREPLGVCLGVCPFNFPAMIPLWMAPLAIATGNTFIVKPSQQVPGAIHILAQLACEAGLPEGVLGVVQGGANTVNALLDAPQIKAVSFVGGSIAGTKIYQRATQLGKRAQCNLGAKNHAVLMPDCNPHHALSAIVGAAFGASGQRCMALSVVVSVGTASKIIPELVEKARSLKLGTGKDADLGPVVSAEAKSRIIDVVETAVQQGATLALDGLSCTGPTPGGNWLAPTILTDVQVSNDAYQKEVFGPVLVCLCVDTLDEAIEMINSNKYANGTSIFTESGFFARRFQSAVDVGQVGVNVPIPLGSSTLGFTGSGGSFLGDLQFYGSTGVTFFTKPKNVLTRWPEQDDKAGVSTSIPTGCT